MCLFIVMWVCLVVLFFDILLLEFWNVKVGVVLDKVNIK